MEKTQVPTTISFLISFLPHSIHMHGTETKTRLWKTCYWVNCASLEIFYIDQEDIERFRMLTGLEDFVPDEDFTRLHATDGGVLDNGDVEVNGPDEGYKSKKTRREDDLLELDDPLKYDHLMVHLSSDLLDRVGPAMVFLPSYPSKLELSNIVASTKSGFALTGTAAMVCMGPSVGLMDVGECEGSYLLRISLTGVNRDASKFAVWET